jgi:hypothetical protein
MCTAKAAGRATAAGVLIAFVAVGCATRHAMHSRAANAPACTAGQVRASADGGNGATGHNFAYYKFRNVSAKPCVLRGFPLVVASQPGRPDVIASHSGWFIHQERSGTMPPGGVTILSIETDRDCPARYAKPNTFPVLIYHTVTVAIPGGGSVVVRGRFDVLCGLFTGRFALRNRSGATQARG